MELNDLIAKLEKASGPDRGLDEAIALAVGWKPNAAMTVLLWDSPDGEVSRASPPSFTASIDAALTLVPEEYDWTLFKEGRVVFHDEAGLFVCDGDAASPALALCIAALKARPHGTEER